MSDNSGTEVKAVGRVGSAPGTRTVLYLRVSSKSQVETDYDPEGLSVPAQRAICQTKAARDGLTIVDEYVELGRSGTNVQGRPAYQEMMQRISRDRDVDVVMVYQLSRLHRNRIDDALVMIQMDAAGVALVSATENIDDSPAGQMTRGILAAINQYRSASEGEDIARKLAHKAKLGGTIGQAKLGYLNVKEEFEGRKVSSIAFDPERADLVRQGFELYASGNYSVQRLAETMADRGLRTRVTRRHPDAKVVTDSTWHRILCDPYYIGLIRYKGETFKGRHEPLVTPELFALVQDVYQERSAPTRRDRTHFHYLKKQLYCDRCHQAGHRNKLVYSINRGGGGTQYQYYVCIGRQKGECDLPHLPVALVEDYVVRHYGTLRLPENFIGTVTNAISEALREEQATLRELHDTLIARLSELDTREERLIDLAEQGLPQEKIRARLSQLREDRARIEADRDTSGAALVVGAEKLKTYLRLIHDVQRLYRDATDHARGLLNDAFFHKLYVNEQGVQGEELKEPVKEILDAARLHTVVTATGPEHENSAPGQRSDTATQARGAAPNLSDVLVAMRGNHPSGSSRTLLAERARFELAVSCPTPVFKTGTLNHSATSPYAQDRCHKPLGHLCVSSM